MPFEREKQSPFASFGALNLSSPAVSFLPRKSRTFLVSASSLQATIGLMTLAASAIGGKRSARIARHRQLFMSYTAVAKRLCNAAPPWLRKLIIALCRGLKYFLGRGFA